jgi:CDI toxin RNase A-like protein
MHGLEPAWLSDPLLRSLIDDLRRHIRRRRLAADVLKYEGQPRDEIGRWTGGGGGDRNDPRVLSDAPADDAWKPGARYAQVDPKKDRLLNKHIRENHVGKTDEELKARIRRERLPGLFVSAGRDRSGSFASEESARDFISRTIDNNPDEVSRVASGRSKAEFLTWRFGYETGREAYIETPNSEIRIRKTYNVGVLIAHDPSSEYGYRVVTAFPRNYNPRIGR